MPFDGATQTRFVSLEDALLDMVEFALDGGKKWMKGRMRRGEKHCLIGAVYFVRDETGCRSDRMEKYLTQAVINWHRRRGDDHDYFGLSGPIMHFNDARARRFSDIVEVIREARKLAQVDAYVAQMEASKPKPDPEIVCRDAPGSVIRCRVQRPGRRLTAPDDPGAVSASRAKAPAPA